MLEQLCKEHTDLTREDICQLQQIRAQLPLMADLMGQDVFLDCLTCDGCVMVVAQAQPSTADSAYRQNVVGEYALREKEPAVYHALQSHAPARDIKAVTQEDCAVRQDVVPTQIMRPPLTFVSLSTLAVSSLIIQSSLCIWWE